MYGTDGEIKKEMPLITISFTKTKGDGNEYARQLKMQEDEINAMEVGNWQKARAKFITFGRDNADTKVKRREAFIEILIKHPVDALEALKNQGLLNEEDSTLVNTVLKMSISESDKKKALVNQADKVLKKYGKERLAVLHTLDQIAGGLATKYGDKITIFGDTDVNSDIGNQWYNQNVELIDIGVKGVESKAKMNIKIN